MTKYYFNIGELSAHPANLPVLRNYRADLSADADFVGAWFLREDFATLAAGKVASFANWKVGGGPALVQATAGLQAALVDDATLGHKVALFDNVAKTRYTGGAFAPNNPWTIVAMVKPDFDAQEQIAGLYTSNPESGGLRTALTNTPAPVFRTYIGSSAPVQSAEVATDAWHKVIASHSGSAAGHLPKIQVNNAAVVVGAAATGNPVAGTFMVSGNSLPYGGRADLLMLFTADLFAPAKASALAMVQAFLSDQYPAI